MRPIWTRLWLLLAALSFLAAGTGSIEAGSVVAYNLEQMTNRADLIFVGHVVGKRAEWNADRTRIYTSFRARSSKPIFFSATTSSGRSTRMENPARSIWSRSPRMRSAISSGSTIRMSASWRTKASTVNSYPAPRSCIPFLLVPTTSTGRKPHRRRHDGYFRHVSDG